MTTYGLLGCMLCRVEPLQETLALMSTLHFTLNTRTKLPQMSLYLNRRMQCVKETKPQHQQHYERGYNCTVLYCTAHQTILRFPMHP